MPEIENIEEESRKARKSESLPDLSAGPKEDVNENISREEIIEQTETTNPTSEISKSEIQIMEVHHHPKVEKKNFKEYFFEFIMIFLAVTLGFFAENVRENSTDREREKQYMQSMIEDLKSDTLQINAVMQEKRSRNMMIDSLVFLLTSPDGK